MATPQDDPHVPGFQEAYSSRAMLLKKALDGAPLSETVCNLPVTPKLSGDPGSPKDCGSHRANGHDTENRH